ncbi:MAG: hypothetical protein PHU25_21655 [Deltaproteobacteria bacterium]|nr:hypothetical protein [Deltaproteobacteria bacterium]
MNDVPDREVLLDMLADLQHDLGKHVLVPVSMLRRGAGPVEVRAALEVALRRTRTGPSGVRPARAIWESFAAKHAGALRGRPSYAALEEAVTRALDLERLINGGTNAPRDDIERDLAAVGRAIRVLAEEVLRGA